MSEQSMHKEGTRKTQLNDTLSQLHPQTAEIILVGLIVILSLLYLA